MYFISVILVSIANLATIQCMGNAGPIGDIKVFYISECEKPVENEVVLETFLENVGEDEKALNMRFKIPFDVDDTATFVLVVDKWVDGNWQENFYTVDGNLFEHVNKFASKIWENIRKNIDPPVESEDLLKKGEYELKHFQEIAEHLELPHILYGRFKVYLYFVVDNIEVACRMAEMESISKNKF